MAGTAKAEFVESGRDIDGEFSAVLDETDVVEDEHVIHALYETPTGVRQC